MPQLRIDQFRLHASIGEYEADDLALYLDAAEAFTDDFLEVKLAGYYVEPTPPDPEYDPETGEEIPYVAPEPPDDAVPLPASLRTAVYMLGAHLWAHREAFGDGVRETPAGFFDLIAPYRRWAF